MKLLDLPNTIRNDHSNLYIQDGYKSSGVYKHPAMPDYALIVDTSPNGTVYNVKYSMLDIVIKQNDMYKEPEFTSCTIPVQQPVITATDLLRAIAITQDPKLSTTLLHPSMR